jgi:hypothetical protein
LDGIRSKGQQQPPAQLLLYRVMPVTCAGLEHLRNQRLRVAQQQALDRPAAVEFLLEDRCRQAVTMPGSLHHCRARRGVAPHEQRNAQHSFVADAGNFGRYAGFHDVEHRNDRGGREIHVRELAPRLVERVAEQHRHGFERGCEPREFCRGHGGEQVVLGGTGRYPHDQLTVRLISSTPMPR